MPQIEGNTVTSRAVCCDLELTQANIVQLNKAGITIEQALVNLMVQHAEKHGLEPIPGALRKAFRDASPKEIPLGIELFLTFSAHCLEDMDEVLFRIKITAEKPAKNPNPSPEANPGQ